MPPRNTPPPILTLLTEFNTWAMERTADFPRPQHYTLGERLDRTAMDALEAAIEARFLPKADKVPALDRINLKVEVLRCFWRVALERKFISASQSLFLNAKLDEIGRMAGAWRAATLKPHGGDGDLSRSS